MSTINYDELNNFFMDYNEREDNRRNYILDQIKLRQKRLADIQMEINSKIYLKTLVERDIVSVIQSDINNEFKFNMFAGLNANVLWQAWRWFWYKDKEDIIKEKDKEESEKSYNYVINTINRKLLNEDKNYKLVEIYDYNYGKFYDFVYDYKGIKLEVSIPVFCKADVDDYNQYLCGYTISEKVNDFGWEAVISGLNYEEVATQLKEWIKNKIKANKQANKK